MRGFLLGSTKSAVLACAGAALVLAGAAYGAFVIYSNTVGGSVGGTFSSSTSTAAAVQMSIVGSPSQAIGPGDSTDISVNAADRDPNSAHTINTVTATFATSPSDCAAHLTLSNTTDLVGQTIAPGHQVQGTVTIAADSSLPGDCASGSYTASFGGSAG